jgi:radical SAM protein with 4Fe4S-binding SPASM domain
MMLATRQSLPHFKAIVDEYFDLDLNRIWIKPVNRIGRALDNWDKIKVSPEEYLDFWKKALAYIVKKNDERLFLEYYTKIFLSKILTKECVNFTDLQSPCGAAIGQLAYSYDGSIYTCDEGRLYDIFRLGTVEDKYEDIAASPEACGIVRASINDNPVCEKCAYKPFCGLCPVCSYAERGNVISKLPDRRCEILIGMFDHLFEKILGDANYRQVFMRWLHAR